MSNPVCERCGGRTDDYPDVTHRCICARHEPKMPWTLTEDDKKVLRRMVIDPDR